MPFAGHLLKTCVALAALSLPTGIAYAQTAAGNPSPAVRESAAAVAASPAIRVYDDAISACFTEVTNVDLLEAARTKNKTALNMNEKILSRIQDCMRGKGIPTDFDAAGELKDGQTVAERAELQAIQDALDSGAMPVPAPAPAPAPVPVPSAPAPAQVTAPPPVAVPPTPTPTPMPTPAPELPKTDTGSGEGGSSAKTPRPVRQYWVKPE